MSEKIQSIKGMKDILPEQAQQWRYVERVLATVAAQHGYGEIRLPIMEHTALFSRTIGDHTDVVNKEMYSFADRNGDGITLRPEGTAGCVRAIIQHDLSYGQVQRLYYLGPMFRYERPQKGRYRQFHHFGLEAVGMAGPEVEAEMIVMMTSVWAQLGVSDQLVLQLNSLGTPAVRVNHQQALVAYLRSHESSLDADSQKRLQLNPLRILDSKNPAMRPIIEAAPKLSDFYDEESSAHFKRLCELLDGLDIAYQVNPYLVRGLDYYCHTVFEWVADDLAAQGTVCGGGRYDGLMAQLGGRATPAIGLAMGMERLILLMGEAPAFSSADVYGVHDDEATVPMMQLAEQIRKANPDCRIMVHGGGGGFKAQFKQADRSGASLALVMGENELNDQTATIKSMRGESLQQTVALDQVESVLNELLQIHKGNGS